MRNQNHILQSGENYTLLDSGNGRKLEKFGNYKIIRSEKQALWNVSNTNLWENPDAEYIRTNDKFGDWKINTQVPSPFIFEAQGLKMGIKLTPFGHVGVFPEQEEEWKFIQKKANSQDKILSLFSYTGAATLAAAKNRAEVTHVDASKPAITWAVENQKLSGLDQAKIKWIPDDALKFVKREGRRGNKYTGIIMDPPKFGRGPKGEVWQFEKDFPDLLNSCKEILSSEAKFFTVTAYAVPVSPITLGNMLSDLFKNKGEIEYGELGIEEFTSGRVLPTAFYASWHA